MLGAALALSHFHLLLMLIAASRPQAKTTCEVIMLSRDSKFFCRDEIRALAQALIDERNK